MRARMKDLLRETVLGAAKHVLFHGDGCYAVKTNFKEKSIGHKKEKIWDILNCF